MTPKPVIIEEYNHEWPRMFNEIKIILHNTLGNDALSIEHVGSTSIPGLAAKPILDIDVVIESMKSLPVVISKLASLGYYHEGNLGVQDREAFGRKDDYVPYSEELGLKPAQYVYVCNRESRELRRHLAFRDALIQNPELVAEYACLKKELSLKFRNDRVSYTEGKSDFVNRVLEQYGNQTKVVPKINYPAVITERLLLRELTLADAPSVFKHFSYPEVTQFMDIEVCQSIEEAEDIIAFHIHDTGCRYGLFSKEAQQLIGTCGYHCWMVDEKGARAEIGFDLSPVYWGKGFMYEALIEFIRVGFDIMNLDYIEATTETENIPSQQLLERLGFCREHGLRDGLVYFALTKSDRMSSC